MKTFKEDYFLGRKLVDLTGQKFGRLTVIEFVGKDKNYRNMYNWKCECGNFKIVIKISY